MKSVTCHKSDTSNRKLLRKAYLASVPAHVVYADFFDTWEGKIFHHEDPRPPQLWIQRVRRQVKKCFHQEKSVRPLFKTTETSFSPTRSIQVQVCL